MKGQLRDVGSGLEIEIVEPIPWPQGGLSGKPISYQAGLLGAAGTPVPPGARALLERLSGYVNEMLASCGCQPAGATRIAFQASRPKFADVSLRRALAGPLDPVTRERLDRRLNGLCCGPVVAYTDRHLTWYQCANCARLFCPDCLAADLSSEQTDDDRWILACPACSFTTAR